MGDVWEKVWVALYLLLIALLVVAVIAIPIGIILAITLSNAWWLLLSGIPAVLLLLIGGSIIKMAIDFMSDF